jgi:hypothetical protein
MDMRICERAHPAHVVAAVVAHNHGYAVPQNQRPPVNVAAWAASWNRVATLPGDS